MTFIVFLTLFIGLCGWLDTRVDAKQASKILSGVREEK